MVILKEERQTEFTVKKSRFISIARICNDINDVKDLVKETSLLYPDATHVVHAAVVGNQFSFSDAHEPKGTAGRPALEVLKGSKISNICVLIIRYFGGTLLGTGGLVKAYGDAVKLVLDGIVTEEKIEKIPFTIQCEYSFYDSVKNILKAFSISDLKETFDTDVKITGLIPITEKEKLSSSFGNNIHLTF